MTKQNVANLNLHLRFLHDYYKTTHHVGIWLVMTIRALALDSSFTCAMPDISQDMWTLILMFR